MAGEPRGGQLQGDRNGIPARIPVFGMIWNDPENPNIGIGRPLGPPRLRFGAPQFPCLGGIAQRFGSAGHAEIGVGAGIGESEAHVRCRFDFFVLGAPLIRDEPDAARIPVGQRVNPLGR
jgi:hypothetical protein